MTVVVAIAVIIAGLALVAAPANVAAIRFVRDDLARVGSAYTPRTKPPGPCQSIQRDPALDPYFQGLRQLAFGCPGDAIPPLEAAARGGDSRARIYLARALFEAARVDEAISEWIELDLSGDRPGLVARIGAYFAGRFERKAAIHLIGSYLAEADAHDVAIPEAGSLYFQLGKAFAQEGQIQAADLWLRRAVDDRPNDDLAWFELGRVFADNRRLDELAPVLAEMRQRFPESGLPLLLEGLTSDNPGSAAQSLAAGVARLPVRIPYTYLADEMRMIAFGMALRACDARLVADLVDELGRRRPDLLARVRTPESARLGLACAQSGRGAVHVP